MKHFILLLPLLLSQVLMAQKASIELESMNVVYIGLDNPVRIAVEGYRSKDLRFTTKNCTLKLDSGKYYLHAGSRGDAYLYISDKKGKALDTAHFRVRTIPKPEAKFGTLESGTHSSGAIMAQPGVYASLGEGFAYENVKFNIISYDYFLLSGTYPLCGKGRGTPLPPELLNMLRNSKEVQLIIYNIKAQRDTDIRELRPMVIRSKEYLSNNWDAYEGSLSNGIKIIRDDELSSETPMSESPFHPVGWWRFYSTCGTDTTVSSSRYFHPDGSLAYAANYYPSGQTEWHYSDSSFLYASYHPNGKPHMRGEMILGGDSLIKIIHLEDIRTETYRRVMVGVLPGPDTFLIFPTVFDAVPIGLWEVYYSSGKLKATGNFGLVPAEFHNRFHEHWDQRNSDKKRCSTRVGTWRFYNEDGSLKYEITYDTSKY